MQEQRFGGWWLHHGLAQYQMTRFRESVCVCVCLGWGRAMAVRQNTGSHGVHALRQSATGLLVRFRCFCACLVSLRQGGRGGFMFEGQVLTRFGVRYL